MHWRRGRACLRAARGPARCVPADVDDCVDSPCCQQVCTNSPGGYECSCYAGYRLSADGCGCEGEWATAGSRGEGAPRGGERGWPWARVCRPVRSAHPLAAPSLASLWPWGRGMAVVGPPAGQRGHRVPRPRRTGPAALLCPQTWTSVRRAKAAVSTAAPTWPAPSGASARPASGWTRTAGAAPVSLRLLPQGPLPRAPGTRFLGRLHLALALPPAAPRVCWVQLWSARAREGTSSPGLRTVSGGQRAGPARYLPLWAQGPYGRDREPCPS